MSRTTSVSHSIRLVYKNVSVSDDRDKGVVTLGGQVATNNAKFQAESLAKSLAGAQVVADQIAVIPVGAEKAARAVNSDLDQGIEKNLDAALIQNKLHDNVTYTVKSGVVTLSGEVRSEDTRTRAGNVTGRGTDCGASGKRFAGQRPESQFLSVGELAVPTWKQMGLGDDPQGMTLSNAAEPAFKFGRNPPHSD